MIGKDIVVSEQRVTRKGRDIDLSVLKDSQTRKHKLNLFNTVSLMLSIWPPIFPFVASVNRCGIVQDVLLFLGTALLMYLASRLFLYTWVFGSAFSYEDIWDITFPRARHIPAILTVLSYLSMCVNLTLSVPFIVAGLVKNVTSLSTFFANRWFLGYLMFLIAVVLCMVGRRISSLYLVALLSNFCWIVAVVSFLTSFATQAKSEGSIPLFTSDVKESFASVRNAIYGLFLTPMLAGIGTNIDKPSMRRIHSAFAMTFGVRGIGILLLTLCGYFLDDLDGIVWGQKNPCVSIVVTKVCVSIASVLANSLIMFEIAQKLCMFTLPGSEESPLAVTTGVLVVGSLSMVITLSGDIEKTNHVIISIGAVCECILALICGPLTFVSVFGFSEKKLSVMGVMLIIVGTVLVVALIWSAVV